MGYSRTPGRVSQYKSLTRVFALFVLLMAGNDHANRTRSGAANQSAKSGEELRMPNARGGASDGGRLAAAAQESD